MKCSIENCQTEAKNRGWCGMHYQRWYKLGDPNLGRTPNGAAEAFYKSLMQSKHGEDCVVWPFTRNKKGYAMMNRAGRQQFVHRIACEELYGLAPSIEHQVAHSCGNGWGGCVSPKHIRWATPAENAQDRQDHGTQVKGEACPYAKLTGSQVEDIRALLGHVSQPALAAKFRVSTTAIRHIKARRTWK